MYADIPFIRPAVTAGPGFSVKKHTFDFLLYDHFTNDKKIPDVLVKRDVEAASNGAL